MDPLEPASPLFALDDPVAGVAAQVEWLDIIRAVSESAPDHEPELWLGQLVVEVQSASDRVVATARSRADFLITEARAEAVAIREAGRRRTHAVVRVRAALQRAADQPSLIDVESDIDIGAPSPPAPGAHQRAPEPSESEPVSAPPASAPLSVPPPPPPPSPPARLTTLRSAYLQRPPLEPAAVQRRVSDTPRQSGAKLRLQPKAALVAVAIIATAIGFVAFERYGTAARERGSQRHLTAELARAEATRPTATSPVNGAAFGSLTVPRLGIKGMAIVEGATPAHLRRGPVHDSRSQLPGHEGAVTVIGHRSTYGGPFARLGELRVGDVISLRTPHGLYVYRVRRNPQVLSSAESSLTLPSAAEVTSGGGSAEHVGQVLLLATGTDSRGLSARVVVATLDQASATGAPTAPHLDATSGQLRAVPGQRVGLLFALWWLGVAASALFLSRRLTSFFPAKWVIGATSIMVVITLYQVYLALDRVVPGTA